MARDRIDVHAHYLGGSIGRLFERGPALTGNHPITARWTPRSAIEFMDRHEIATQILSVPWAFNNRAEIDFAEDFCRAVNEEYAELIRDHPGRFGAFAAIPPTSTEAALAELAHALDELGLDGALLSSNVRGRYLGDPFFEPVLAELERRRVPAFVHPEECPHIGELGFGRPSSVVEFPFDTARTVTNAIYTGVFQRHPGLRIVLAHCGGTLPTLGWRIAEHADIARGPDDAAIDSAHVTEVLRGLHYETALAGDAHTLLPTLEVTSPDHVLFGTDWPAAPEWAGAHNTANLVDFAARDDVDLSGVDRANAARLFPRFSSHARTGLG